jgi:nitrite reductase (cytochrome c-552)
VKGKHLITLSVLVILVLTASGIVFFMHNNQVQEEVAVNSIASNEVRSQVWGNIYPRHWDSYMKNYDNKEQPSHFTSKPYMEIIYAGTGFAVAFNEPRGHTYTLEDIQAIDPARKKAGAACNTCKSTQIPGLIQQYGDAYYQMSFDEINKQLTEPIGCLDCHDPQTLELRLTRPALIEALQRQGKDLNKISHQEMRSLVCAQCHVTYYFEPESKKLVFPWDKGVKAEEILAYFDEKNFDEWTHPIAGSQLVKARHAEYESFLDSTHESTGLACADCHMPYVKIGNTKISSHDWRSPMDNVEASCTVCHRNGVDWLEQRVAKIQTQCKGTQDLAGQAVVQTIKELAVAKDTAGVDQEKLKQAQLLHRKAQWYLDYVMVTNGYGFHNPGETLNNLSKAIDYAHQATALAREARIPTSP